MASLYTHCGKQVMRAGQHFADACDSTAAQIITDALNARLIPRSIGDREALAMMYKPPTHIVSSVIDGYSCTCGRRWDHDEGDECPAIAG